MGAQYVQTGNYLDYMAPADVAAGDVVVQGDLVGIAHRAIGAGEPGSIAVVGVFDLPKATGTAIVAGAKIYWDAAQKKAVTVDGSGANKYAGKATQDATDTAPFVRVRLSQ